MKKNIEITNDDNYIYIVRYGFSFEFIKKPLLFFHILIYFLIQNIFIVLIIQYDILVYIYIKTKNIIHNV
jgi:hypothetical protein